jgi:hypothetical protein
MASSHFPVFLAGLPENEKKKKKTTEKKEDGADKN